MIGYSVDASRKIVQEGYKKIQDLAEVTEEHFVHTLEKCAKQHKKTQFPSCAQFKLLVAHFYSTTCRRHGNLPSAQEIANSSSYMSSWVCLCLLRILRNPGIVATNRLNLKLEIAL